MNFLVILDVFYSNVFCKDGNGLTLQKAFSLRIVRKISDVIQVINFVSWVLFNSQVSFLLQDFHLSTYAKLSLNPSHSRAVLEL